MKSLTHSKRSTRVHHPYHPVSFFLRIYRDLNLSLFISMLIVALSPCTLPAKVQGLLRAGNLFH